MKVLFQGSYYDVPEWANYLAKDDSGQIYAYENKPRYDVDLHAWQVCGGEYEYVGNANCIKIVKAD